MKSKDLEQSRWGIAELSATFGRDTRLLKRRLNDAGHGAEVSWTIRQCHEALTGDGSLESLRAAKTLLTQRQDELAKLDVEERRGQLVDLDALTKVLAPIILEALRLVEDSSMSEAEKHELRSAWASLFDASK